MNASKRKPKVLFIYDHDDPDKWQDGLSAALDLLEEDFEIEMYNIAFEDDAEKSGESKISFGEHEFILGWGAFKSKVDNFCRISSEEYKTGLCVAGNVTPTDGAENYDVLFYETDWINENYLPDHPNKVKAFGTNTDLFAPADINTPIVWDYVGVGAFASWKRWEKMTEKEGNKLVVGQYQVDNENESLGIIRHLVQRGVMVSNNVSPLDLVNIYHWSRRLYAPADIQGGCERAVLEARACGLPVEIEGDNPKLKELLEMETIPSHHDYAKALKDGIMDVL